MKRRLRQSRSGMAIIIVLTMVSIALAVSYAMLRSQTTTAQVQSNNDRRLNARSAAMAGLAAGIRRMHLNSWGGVGTTLSGTLNDFDSYTVTYAAGDPSLKATSPDFMKWHIRVTVTAVGKSVSATNRQVAATHTLKAVLQLVPRQLGSQPANWPSVSNYTLYQTSSGQFTMDVPGRIEGPVRLQGAVRLGTGISWSSTARSRYFSDLNAMRSGYNEVQLVTVSNATGGDFRLTFNGSTTSNLSYNASASTVRTALRALASISGSNVEVSGNNGGPYTVTFMGALANQNVPQMTAQNVSLSGSFASVSVSLQTQGSAGYPDCRPLTGPVSLPLSSSDSTNLALLSSLGLTTTNIGVSSAMSPPLPNSLSTYRIYTGGPTYSVPQVASNLINTSLTPDPQSNPLGIYFCAGSMSVCNNVTIAGTLICGSTMTLCGTNVVVQPVGLWALSGSSTAPRLPVLVARQNLRTDTMLSTAVNGMVLVGQQCLIDEGDPGAAFSVTGRLVTNEFVLKRRNNWSYSSFIWSALYSMFNSQSENADGTPFYPIYLAYYGCNPVPTLTVRPDPSSLTDHWQNLANPIYVAHPGDPGLRWDVISTEAEE